MALVESTALYLDGLAGDLAVGTGLAPGAHYGQPRSIGALAKTPTGIFLYCDYTGSTLSPSLKLRLNFHTPGKSNERWPIADSAPTAFGAGWNSLYVSPVANRGDGTGANDPWAAMETLLAGDVVNAFVPPLWSVEFTVSGTGTIDFNAYFMFTF